MRDFQDCDAGKGLTQRGTLCVRQWIGAVLQCVHEAKRHTTGDQDLCNDCVLSQKKICQSHGVFAKR